MVVLILVSGLLVLMSRVTQAEQQSIIIPEKPSARLGKGTIEKIAYTPDGKLLAVAGSVGVWLYDAVNLTEVGLLESPTGLSSLAISPDGNTIAAGSNSNQFYLWDLETKRQIGQLEEVWSFDFSPDGETIALGKRNDIRLWDVETQQQVGMCEGHTDNVLSLDFSSDGNTLASASRDGTVRLWDMETQQQIGLLSHPHEHVVSSVAFSPDGKMLASAGVEIFMLTAPQLADHDEDEDGIRLWDVETQQQVGLLQTFMSIDDYTIQATLIAFSPDGKLLASISEEGIHIWDVETQQQMGILKGHTDKVLSLDFSPDGKTLASGGYDSKVRLWDVETQKQVGVLKVYDTEGTVTFSPDGKLLASGSRKGIRLWDIETQQQVGMLEGYGTVAFSPDGKWLASGNLDGTILLWKLGTGSLWNVNLDGIVDVLDLAQVASQFGQSGSELNGDVNKDGVIDVLDLVLVGSHFGEHVISAAPPMRVSSHLKPSQRLNQR